MGSLVVVLLTKPVERALLGGEIRARRPNGSAFEGLMHAFVGPVLLGMRGQDALMLNAQDNKKILKYYYKMKKIFI